MQDVNHLKLVLVENGLMDKHAEDLDEMDFPFKWQYIPLDYPQPDVYMVCPKIRFSVGTCGHT